jgi:solute carrier family 39 (zinc transporter), member 7
MALTRRSVVCSAVCLALLVGLAYAGHDHEHVEAVSGVNTDNMSLEELDTQLQVRLKALPRKDPLC